MFYTNPVHIIYSHLFLVSSPGAAFPLSWFLAVLPPYLILCASVHESQCSFLFILVSYSMHSAPPPESFIFVWNHRSLWLTNTNQ